MTKLTKMTDKGVALILPEFYENQDEAKEDRKARLIKALEKLYLYETLELEPEEIYDLLQSTAAIRSRLNKTVTWKSPHKDKAYKAKLGAVKIARDDQTGRLRLSAELLIGKQRNIILADIKHIQELANTKIE